jgi:hypothetical protein
MKFQVDAAEVSNLTTSTSTFTSTTIHSASESAVSRNPDKFSTLKVFSASKGSREKEVYRD